MALEGSLQIFSLPEILQMIALQHKTGILTVQGEADIVAVSFLKGDVVSADALNRTVEESLGEDLVARGVVRREDFLALAAEQQSGAGRLVDLLIQRELIQRDRLLELLHEQTYRLLLSLLRWREGDFKFYGGEEVAYEEGFAPIHVHELLIRAVSEGVIEPKSELTEVTRFPAPVAPAEPPAAVVPASPGATPTTTAPTPPGLLPDLPDLPDLPELPSRPELPRPPTPARPRLVRVTPRPVAAGPRPAEAVTTPVWPGRALAGFLTAALFTVLWTSPRSVALPYPWQGGARETLERSQRAALYGKIDRAARTFFLLEGRYANELERLAAMRLLSPRDLTDPGSHPLAYSTNGLSYTLQPVAAGEPVEGLGTQEAITGDFLLDPEFLKGPVRSESQPLVLID